MYTIEYYSMLLYFYYLIYIFINILIIILLIFMQQHLLLLLFLILNLTNVMLYCLLHNKSKIRATTLNHMLFWLLNSLYDNLYVK